jgi:2-keto-4-pentenoate hydratase
VALAGLCQPRLEPEVVFGMRATPPDGASLEQLFACIDWLATGFEIVQLQQCPGAPSLREGDVVTTGTWTDAWPVQPGQVWRAEFDAPLRAIEVTLR